MNIRIAFLPGKYGNICFGMGYSWIDDDRFFFIDFGLISLEIGGRKHD